MGVFCGMFCSILVSVINGSVQKELATLISCRVVAPDLRGHGDTKCSDEHDLSKETQIK